MVSMFVEPSSNFPTLHNGFYSLFYLAKVQFFQIWVMVMISNFLVVDSLKLPNPAVESHGSKYL